MIKNLNVFEIVTYYTNLRSEIDDDSPDAVAEQQALTDNLRENPLLNLPTVNFINGTYRCIQGHRRLIALRTLAEDDPDKYSTVDCVVLSGLTDTQVAKLQLSENLLRRGLSAIEIGRTLLNLRDELEAHMSKGDVAAFAGLTPKEYTQYLKVMRLPSDTRNAIERRAISTGHAEQLMRLLPKQLKNDEETALTEELTKKINGLARRVEWESLTVDRLSSIVKNMLDPDKPKKKDPKLTGLCLKADTKLKAQYGDAVQIKGKDGKGFIRMDFSSEQELNGILTQMTFIEDIKREHPEIMALLSEKLHGKPPKKSAPAPALAPVPVEISAEPATGDVFDNIYSEKVAEPEPTPEPPKKTGRKHSKAQHTATQMIADGIDPMTGERLTRVVSSDLPDLPDVQCETVYEDDEAV